MGLIVKIFKEKGIATSTPPPLTRAFTDGHWISLMRGNDNIRKVQGATTFGETLLTPNIQGFMKRSTWRLLEPQIDQYTGLSTTSELKLDLDYCTAQGCKLVVQMEDRTFYNSENPMPQYFGNPTWDVTAAKVGGVQPPGTDPLGTVPNPYNKLIMANTGKIGATAVRWESSLVVPRLKLLLDAFADNGIADHPAFEGFSFQETALGFENIQLHNSGYTSTRYGDFYSDVLVYAATKMPKCRIFWFCNFIPITAPGDPPGAHDNPSGGHDNSQVGRVGDALVASGLDAYCIGGPDTFPEDAGLRSGLYSFMDTVAKGGFKDKIPFGNQFSQPGYGHEWKGVNPTPARYWSMDEMYGFMKNVPTHFATNNNPLSLSYVFWQPVAGSDDPNDNVPASVAEYGWNTGPHNQGFEVAAANPKIYVYAGTTGGNPNNIYVDTNVAVNGNGKSPSSPMNSVPGNLANGQILLFNADNGIQTIPVRDDCIYVDGDDVEIGSYGSTAIAVVSGFQNVTGGWTSVGNNVWKRNWGVAQGVLNTTSGFLVAAVIDKANVLESPQGDVMNWFNLDSNDTGAVPDLRAQFVAAPTVLPVGSYAYDYVGGVLYINVGTSPNTGGRTFGIAGCGRFVSVQTGNSPARTQIHNLRLMGFARAVVNGIRGANNWHVHHNQLYANGGYYSQTNSAYAGSGMQFSHTANNIEIDHNLIEQTFDSPITPQHFGGATGGALDTFHIHHNTIKKWALAAVEISDFGGPGNTTKNLNIEYNIMVGGGTGFSSGGDAPLNFTDAVQIRGTNITVTNLRVANCTLQTKNAAIALHTGSVTDTATIDSCRLSSSAYGLQNQVPTAIHVSVNGTQFCANGIDTSQLSGVVNGSVSGSTYTSNVTQGSECYLTDRAGEGVNY